MSNKAVNFTSPVGRLVWGSLTKARDKDAEGKPLVIKTGPQAGQPRVDYGFGLAIPKGTETHWATTHWGKLIWEAGHAGFPGGQANAPTFAWKVTDGDSQIPNRKGVKPCTKEGYPGHWVLSYSSSYAPKTFNANGTEAIPAESIKNGYYVQVAGNVAANGSANQPGVYLNHQMVALSAYGAEIVSGPDASQVGFGQGTTLPAGASATPVGGMAATGAAPTPPVPATPAAAAPAAPVPPAHGAAPPYNAILGAGAAAAAPAPPPPAAPPAPVAAGRQMTAAANGLTYEQYIASGWNDDMLRANGLMV